MLRGVKRRARTTSRIRTRGTLLLAALLALLALGQAPPAPAQPGALPGQLYAFGNNRFGRLGNAINDTTEAPNPTPALVSLPEASGPVTQAAAGANFSLALTSTGQLYGFGYNRFGQLGSTVNNKTYEPNPTPALVSLPGASGPVAQIAAGGDHSLAVTSTGQLYAFGDNRLGQLGNATNEKTTEPNPTPALVSLPGASGPVTQVAAGSDHSLALTSTGQVYAFGENRFGQLGNATNVNTEEPNPAPALVSLPGASGPVIQIAAGFYYSLALTSTGQLFAFGNNFFGQLGVATNVGTREPNPAPALVSLPGASGPVTQIAAGAYHSLALTSTGQLFAFGNNRFGQLGNATNEKTAAPNPTPALVSLPGASGTIVRIAAGFGHSLVLTSTGQLYVFGGNEYGQLGSAANVGTEEPNPTPAPVTLPGGASIDTVAPGEGAVHTLVVVADLAVGSSPLPAGRLGASYSAQAQASGGAPPYTWSAAGLPPGLTVGSSGAISGTPSAAGSYTATFTVTDANGIEATAPLAIAIAAPAPVRATCAARAARAATVKRATAVLRLAYRGKRACTGSLKLVARAPREGAANVDGKRHRRNHPGKRHRRRQVRIVIGRAHFSIAKGRRVTLRVHLSAEGRSLVRKAGRRGLKVSIRGSHMKAGTVVLERARGARKHGAKRRRAKHSLRTLGLIPLAAFFGG